MVKRVATSTGSAAASRFVRRLAMVAALALVPSVTGQAQLDICGCSGNPNSLGAFSTMDPATYPAGTVSSGGILRIPLPPDGVLVFDSMHLEVRRSQTINLDTSCQLTISFIPNDASTPVTLLVKGNVTFAAGPVCGTYPVLSVAGAPGTAGSSLGVGGLGGPGGFRGGDGAYQLVNLASNGGAGQGPGGGLGAVAAPFTASTPGAFLGIPELLPLLGGSGGGGGMSSSNGTTCSGGGGGGGGGALLIAANGTVELGNGTINADGGGYGQQNSSACSSHGAPGSGGAVRIIAAQILGTGSVFARSGANQSGIRSGTAGAVRLESQVITLAVADTDPIATRSLSPGPVTNPFTPTIAITAVGGQAVPQPPAGAAGKVDLTLPVPGAVAIDLETQGVPSGTTVVVTAKPRVGPAPIPTTITLSNCAPNGSCIATATLNLPAGTHAIEARATFATP